MSSAVPVSFASSLSSFASSRFSKRLDSCAKYKECSHGRNALRTYHAGLKLWRLAVKHVCRLDAVLYHPDGPVEEAHKMTRIRVFSSSLGLQSMAQTHLVVSPASFVSSSPSF